MPNATDLITNAIEDAVERVLERLLPKLIREAMPEPAKPGPHSMIVPSLDGERFVLKAEAAKRLGMSRQTLGRRVKDGWAPPMRELPSGRGGWLLSEVEAMLASLPKKKRSDREGTS